MQLSLINLLTRRKKHYSQAGEDGLIEYMLSKLPTQNRWCVEFGAWDGRFLSNCFHLMKMHSYRGVLIEMDPNRFNDLVRNTEDMNVVCLNRIVDFEPPNLLDEILHETDIPHDFDLLSIDIDGDDYFVWEALHEYTPKIVVIEMNVRNPPGLRQVNQQRSPFVWGVSGTSATSITELARAKGYALATITGCNAVFVRKEFLHIFHSREPSVVEAFTFEGFTWSESNWEMRMRKVLVKSSLAVSRWRRCR